MSPDTPFQGQKHVEDSTSVSDLEEIFCDDLDESAVAQAATSTVASEGSQPVLNFRGRVPGTKNIKRGLCSWHRDYLDPYPVYPPWKFREIFRISLNLYWIIHDGLLEEEPLLDLQPARNGIAHTSHQKIPSSLRRFGSALPFRQLDDMSRMSPESERHYFTLFLHAMVRRFGPLDLNREPTLQELRDITQQYAAVVFPGCLGCVDCMHLKWKNCPKQMKGQYHNPKEGKLATISCEALCDHNLYCWSWFPGRCGTNNDITVLANSPLFIDILRGERRMCLPEGYVMNGAVRDSLIYVLGDGIYPSWAIFVLPNHAAATKREQNMAERQMSVRKDIERLFGCQQGRFEILRQERCEWSDETLMLISLCNFTQEDAGLDPAGQIAFRDGLQR